jgi:hypothetical protein
MKKFAIIGMVFAGLLLSTAGAWATSTGMTKAEYRALMIRSEALNQKYGAYEYPQPALLSQKLGEIGSWAVPTKKQTIAKPDTSQKLEEIGAWAVPSKQTADTPLLSEKVSGLGVGEPTTTAAPSGDGFDWNDAGIGAALVFGAVVLGIGSLLTVRHQHKPIPH